jgi:hypothetical protein
MFELNPHSHLSLGGPSAGAKSADVGGDEGEDFLLISRVFIVSSGCITSVETHEAVNPAA